jgi:MinD superfamily P-loop ATPase
MKIAIASGKGGTGKTFVATNLFAVLRNKSEKARIVDCDSEEPNVAEFLFGKTINRQEVHQHVPIIDSTTCIFCGKCHEYCSYNAIVYLPMGPFIQAIPELCHDCGACSLMCPVGAITEDKRLLGVITTKQVGEKDEMIELRAELGVYTPVPILKKALRQLNDSIITLLDSPPGISCPFIATAEQADYVILVTEPTPFGLNDLKLTVETLREINKPFGVVVNRAGLGNRDVYDWLAKEQIALLMEIPFDREIARIYTEGNLLVDANHSYHELFNNLYKKVVAAIATRNTFAIN